LVYVKLIRSILVGLKSLELDLHEASQLTSHPTNTTHLQILSKLLPLFYYDQPPNDNIYKSDSQEREFINKRYYLGLFFSHLFCRGEDFIANIDGIGMNKRFPIKSKPLPLFT